MISFTDFDTKLVELVNWRREFQTHPVLTFDIEPTIGLVAESLKKTGIYDAVNGIGRTDLSVRYKAMVCKVATKLAPAQILMRFQCQNDTKRDTPNA